jgi:hypothetical protein
MDPTVVWQYIKLSSRGGKIVATEDVQHFPENWFLEDILGKSETPFLNTLGELGWEVYSTEKHETLGPNTTDLRLRRAVKKLVEATETQV